MKKFTPMDGAALVGMVTAFGLLMLCLPCRAPNCAGTLRDKWNGRPLWQQS